MSEALLYAVIYGTVLVVVIAYLWKPGGEDER
jgi:hypothetical protein